MVPLCLQIIKMAYSRLASSVNSNIQSRTKVLQEAIPLLSARQKCRGIWKAIQLADYKKLGELNYPALSVLFEKEKETFSVLFNTRSLEDFLDLLDDHNGTMDEDEQMLMFSIVRERMQQSAHDLCEIQEYKLYRQMMEKIRELEEDIIEYQSSLRNNLHKRQIEAFKAHEQEKIKVFKEKWAKKIESMKSKSVEKLKKLNEVHIEQASFIEGQSFVMRKNAKSVKGLIMEEKILAVNERYEEAEAMKKYIRTYEIAEEKRLQESRSLAQLNRISRLKQKQSNAVSIAKDKFNREMNKLMYRERSEFAILNKESSIHLGVIKNNQKIAQKMAEKAGRMREELRLSLIHI